jgi:hypothetical protein
MTIDWKIENLHCKILENELSNIVYKIQCICKVTDIIDNKSYTSAKRITIVLPIETPDPLNFIEFNNLTKTQVVEWIENSLGEESLSTLTLELSTQNNLKANPIVVTLNPPFNN